MALQPPQRFLVTLFLSISIQYLSSPFIFAGIPDDVRARVFQSKKLPPSMILPLYHSHSNYSTLSSFGSRRHLQRSEALRHPNAHMRLHDDLLLNGWDLWYNGFDLDVCFWSLFDHDVFLVCRYFTTRLWIGTPPQMFSLIVDTGSTVTYVPCSTCEQCGTHQVIFGLLILCACACMHACLD